MVDCDHKSPDQSWRSRPRLLAVWQRLLPAVFILLMLGFLW